MSHGRWPWWVDLEQIVPCTSTPSSRQISAINPKVSLAAKRFGNLFCESQFGNGSLQQGNLHQARVAGRVQSRCGFCEHIGRGNPRAGKGLLTVLRGGPTHIAFPVGESRAARAGAVVRATRPDGQIAQVNGANAIHLRRMLPNVQKSLLPHIAGGQRKLHAGENVPVG